MAIPELPPELIHQILDWIPLSPSTNRAKALRSASLVNSTWREIAQKELARHITWSRIGPGRIECLLRSPSAKGGLAAESITLRRASAQDLWLLVSGIKSVTELSLYNGNERDSYKGSNSPVPVRALSGLRDLAKLTLHRTRINLPASALASLTHLTIGSCSFDPTFTPPLLLAPKLHTLTLHLHSRLAIADLARVDHSKLVSLRTLSLVDSYLDHHLAVPPGLLAFVGHLPSLTTVTLARYYPSHLEALLAAVSTPLDAVQLHVYFTQNTFPSVGRLLRRAAGRSTLRGVRRWEVVLEPGVGRWAAERGWEDDDWRAWKKSCDETGVVVDVEVVEEYIT